MLRKYVEKLKFGEHLSQEESYNCLSEIFLGNCELGQIKELLLLLSEKGETVEEIVGFAIAMREKMLAVPINKNAIDICGTGGTDKDRFNVSTSISFILAASGVPVAKHGNRGSKKPNGSFDFLEALDIKYDFSVKEIIDIFDSTELCFLFARNHHMAVKHVAMARKELGRRTIFNMIGPLCNPAKVPFQIIGTVSESLAEKLAKAVQILGVKRAFIIVGGNGLDELSIDEDSIIYDVTEKNIDKSIFSPKSISYFSGEIAIKGGEAKENADTFKKLFSKRDLNHPIMKMIILNAGAAMYCFGKVDSIKQGVELSIECVRDGRAWDKYLEYKALAS
jgi:anthranilate phosphoribosyltransferase